MAKKKANGNNAAGQSAQYYLKQAGLPEEVQQKFVDAGITAAQARTLADAQTRLPNIDWERIIDIAKRNVLAMVMEIIQSLLGNAD